VHEQDDGVAPVLAAHVQPLVDAADAGLVRFLDAARGGDALQVVDGGAGAGQVFGIAAVLGQGGQAEQSKAEKQDVLHGASAKSEQSSAQDKPVLASGGHACDGMADRRGERSSCFASPQCVQLPLR